MLPQGEIIPFNPHLVTQSVNYHGHKLLQHIVSDNAGQIHSIKLQDIDYKVYQSRQVELKNLGGSRIKEIIEFISSKSDKLLVAQPELTNVKKVEETNYEDRYKHQIPFEFFLKADKNIRVDELLTHIEDGDILYAEVVNNFENTAYTLLKPIAYDKGKHRFMSDLRPSDLKIILRNEDTTVPKADEDKIGRWMVGTRLRVEVLSIHLTGSVPTVFVGTKGVTLSSEAKEKFKLGKVVLKDLPQILSVSIDPSLRFVSDCIEKMDSYKNPQCIRQMADEMGIKMRWYPTLLSSVRVDFIEKEKSESLRKAQMCKWAHKNVADGVAHFKQGQHEEAFQCLNKALQIDSENVEAFVAKGALLANLGRYEKAIEDFEKSLKLNPNHSNARKYMCETLVELGKQKETKDLLKEAEKCYSRCLELNQSHEVARESLDSVSEKLGPESNLMKLIKQENLKQNDEYLANLLKIEEIAKKKSEEEKPIPIINQNRDESKDEKLGEDNPIPIITSKYKYEEEFENEDSTQMSPEAHPLSPLSQKLANEEGFWSHHPPPPCPAPSYIGSLVSNQTSQGGNLPMSVYSNPSPNWPMPDITRPPPMARMSAAAATAPAAAPSISEVAKAYSEDSNHKARVEQFLKELESRALKGRASTSSQEPRRRSSQKEETKIHKRRRSSSSDSKASRSGSSSSSSSSRSRSSSKSSSSSSSKSSTRSSSVDSRKRKKKVTKKAKKNKKKKKVKKKEKKAKKKMTSEVDVAVPEFDDLEEKLMAYYKKLETINSTPPATENKTKSKNKSPSSKELKSKDSQEEDKEKEKTTSVTSKLRLLTHPAFLENDSDSDAELELKKKKAEKHRKMLSKIKSSTSESSPKTIAEKVLKAAQACEKAIKISSPSSPSTLSSRSRSRSHSKGRSRRSRSHSKSRSRRSRSRSHSKGRSRRSRSRSHSKGRPRRSRSHSRERRGRRSRSRSPSYRSRPRNYTSRPRSRSRSAGRYRSNYHKYSRSRSRERPSRYRRSRSRSPPPTQKPKINKIPMHESPFSYYGNKPLYKNKSIDNKNGTGEKTSDIPLPKDAPKPSPLKFEIRRMDRAGHLVEDAKRKIQEHILSNDKLRNTSSTGRKDEKSNIVDPSQRFGKWASETKANSTRNLLDMFKERNKLEFKDKN